jgi:hypothetical protein
VIQKREIDCGMGVSYLVEGSHKVKLRDLGKGGDKAGDVRFE